MASDKSITTAKKISGDQDSDASLFGGILASHADQLLKLSLSTDVNVRFAAVELTAVLLQQGQVNPNDAVPYLLALQGDHVSTAVRERALHLLMDEGRKHPDALRQRVCMGVKRAYDFQRSLQHGGDVTALAQVRVGDATSTECVFGNVFKECLVRNRKERQGFYRNLLAYFVDTSSGDPGDELIASPQRPKKRRKSDVSSLRAERSVDVGLLCFASQILAHLPYEASGDPLFIIREIVETCWLHEGPVLEGFATLLKSVGLSSSDTMDVSASEEEDALERAARSKFPSKTKEAKALSQGDFDLRAFAGLCCRGAAFTLLLRLKLFLQQLYSLSDVRIAEYDPHSKESTADKSITKSAKANAVFDSKVGCGTCRGGAIRCDELDLDQLIRMYAEFRRTMRAESVDADTGFLDNDEGGVGVGAGDADKPLEEGDGAGVVHSPAPLAGPPGRKPRDSRRASH
jgi:cohesin loading factor subunit SCC2